MGLTNFPNGVSSFGIPMLGGGGVPATFGNVYFVDNVYGDNGYAGTSSDKAWKTLEYAYSKVTTSNDDVICLSGGGASYGTHEIATMITWSKNKVHLVGLSTGGATDQEPRVIFTTAGKTSEVAALMKVTGFGNTFTNVRFNSWSTATAGVTSVWDAGENNVYTNCQFNMFENLAETTSHDFEARGDSSTFRNCKFGSDTLNKTAARPVLLIKGTGGSARMKNNYFEDCYFVTQTTQVTSSFIKVNDNNSLAFQNVWKNCVFMSPIITSTSAVQLTDAITSSSGLAEGSLLFVNPVTNAASFCGTVTDRVEACGYGVAPSTTTTVGLAITPT